MMTGKAIMPSPSKQNMKRRIHWKWSLGLALAVLPFAGREPQESLSQPTNTTPAVEAAAAPEKAPAPEPAAAEPAMAEQAAEDDVVNAPAEPISTDETATRPGSSLRRPWAEVLKLADSGVEESVMLAFVTNSASTFNLSAEEIIYLNDIGVPSAVVTAMIQRDQALKASLANVGPWPGGTRARSRRTGACCARATARAGPGGHGSAAG